MNNATGALLSANSVVMYREKTGSFRAKCFGGPYNFQSFNLNFYTADRIARELHARGIHYQFK